MLYSHSFFPIFRVGYPSGRTPHTHVMALPIAHAIPPRTVELARASACVSRCIVEVVFAASLLPPVALFVHHTTTAPGEGMEQNVRLYEAPRTINPFTSICPTYDELCCSQSGLIMPHPCRAKHMPASSSGSARSTR